MVEDVGHGVDVDAAGGDVGGDEDLHGAGSEGVEGAFALALRFVAVEGFGGDAGLGDRGADFVGDVLLEGEDHGLAHAWVSQERQEGGFLVGGVDEHDGLVDAVDGGGGRGDFDFGRVVQEGVGEGGDGFRHGGREEHRVAVVREGCDDAFDGFCEAHVEHLIGLVEDECLELGEVAEVLGDEVEQSAGGCDDDVDAGFEGLDLVELADAAEDGCDGRVLVATEGFEAGGDLGGELAGGGEDEDACAALGGRAGCAGEAVQEGEGEGGGFAGSGLGQAEEVAAFQEEGDGLGLDGGGGGVAFFGEGLQEGGRQSEVGEGHQHGGRRLRRVVAAPPELGGCALGRGWGGLLGFMLQCVKSREGAGDDGGVTGADVRRGWLGDMVGVVQVASYWRGFRWQFS